MSALNKFLGKAFSQAKKVLPQTTIILDGISVSAHENTYSVYNESVLGGLEPQDACTLTVSTTDLPVNYALLEGTKVLVDGVQWRIIRFDVSHVYTHINLCDPNAS